MAKILLVEDDKSLREIYGVRLQAEGYEIVSAGDGEEALAMAIKEKPDLIVSDVMMPKISGFDMLDILRSTTETKNVKVIMMTALSSDDQRARGEALGADRYLVKSQVGIEDVVRTVHDVLADGIPAPAAAPSFPSTNAPTPAPQPAPLAAAPTVSAPEPIAQPAPAPVPAPEPVAAAPAPQPYIPPTPAPTPGIDPLVAPAPVAQPQPVAPVATPEPIYAPVPPAPVYNEIPVAPAPIAQPAPAPVPAPEPVAAAPAPQPYIPPTPAPTPQPVVDPFTAPVAPFPPAPQQVAPQPIAQPYVTPQESTLPQPTAPFSSPAPASLGERVIQPLINPDTPPLGFDIASQMEQALGSTPAPQGSGNPPLPPAA